MRFRAQSFAFFAVPVLLLTVVACSDDPPIYPPIVINIVGNGAVGVGASSSTGATSSVGDQTGGGSDSTDAGTSNTGTGGSAMTGGLLAHCSAFNGGPAPAVKTKCDLDKLVDGGEVKGDITADLTLKSGHSYTLKGVVRVMQSKTLTIEPCVKVMGADSTAVLIVLSSALGNPVDGCRFASGAMTPGGKLSAIGEPMAPIVFTSSKPVGQRAASDWGGVMLLGNARNNQATSKARVFAEGLVKSECHGYNTDEFNGESSGHLEYVRIEYASQRVGTGSETNGLTFASIGSGTEVHYVEVSNSGDDCFEWFGGTVNADHLIALNCDDDMFDGDNGYSGHLQYLFGRQGSSSSDEMNSHGFEISSSGLGLPPPLTTEQISNATLCGSGPKVTAMNDRGGIFVEQSPDVHVLNTFITGFTTTGNAVYGVKTPEGFKLDSTHIYKQKMALDVTAKPTFLAGKDNGCDDDACGKPKEVVDRFCDCWANPPAPVAATTPAGLAPSGFQDEAANHVGAFKDATPDSNWMRGLWVDWASK